LGAIVGSYKAAVSKNINRLRPGAATEFWQANYYDHIIRHGHALDVIREYIVTNPQRWEEDAENPLGAGSDRFDVFLQKVDVPAPKKGDASAAPTEGER
jgi:hypothetical protein